MNEIVEVLVDQWLYDVSVLSQPWVLWTVFPALIYFAFMIAKWCVLTLPVWLPFVIIRGSK